MREIKLGKGILYYGSEPIAKDVVVNGEKCEQPRLLIGSGYGQAGIFRLRRQWFFEKNLWVVNYSHPDFAVGVSTSGGLGFFISLTDVVKRGGANPGDTHREFNGAFAQLGFHWFKLYLYIYPDQDGLK
jgi:hypothetical protein